MYSKYKLVSNVRKSIMRKVVKHRVFLVSIIVMIVINHAASNSSMTGMKVSGRLMTKRKRRAAS